MDTQNIAYDLSIYETAVETKQTDTQEKNKKPIKLKNKYAFKSVVNVLSIAVVVSLIIAVIYTNSEITNTTNSITKTENSIVELESEKDYLEFTVESRMTLSEIEDYAIGTLGMVKMDPSQIEYIEIEDENKIEFSGENLKDKIEDAVKPILSYFMP